MADPLAEVMHCLQSDTRSHVIDWVGSRAPELVPEKPVSNVRTGRWGRVLVRTHNAVKIQKVVLRACKLQQVEWRDGPAKTKITLDAMPELIAARFFGILGLGPVVKQIALVRKVPRWVDEDRCDECWYLLIVMERLHGSFRDIKNMPAAEAAAIWKGMDTKRLARMVTDMAKLRVVHGDIRLDNICYKRVTGGVKPFWVDAGYSRIRPRSSPSELAREMGRELTKVVRDAGAPTKACSAVRRLTVLPKLPRRGAPGSPEPAPRREQSPGGSPQHA